MESDRDKLSKARAGLAYSQSLRDKFRVMPIQEQEMEEEGIPQDDSFTDVASAQESSQQELSGESSEQKGFIEGVKEVVQPMFEELKSLFTKKEEEPKEAVLKVEGVMEPKEKEEE